MSLSRKLRNWISGLLSGATLLTAYPAAADDAQVEQLQRQINVLQQQLQLLQKQVTETKKAVSTRPPPGPPAEYTKAPIVKSPPPSGVNIKIGGFIEAASIWRQRNEVADLGSDLNTGIPLPNSPLYHENEFRGSARQS